MIIKAKTRDPILRKKLIQQKAMGLALIALAVLLCYIASTGVSIEDRDITPVILFAPMGLWLLFTNKVHIE